MWCMLIVLACAVEVAGPFSSVAAAAAAMDKLLGGGAAHFVLRQPDGQVFGVGQNAWGELGCGFASEAAFTPQHMLGVHRASDVCAAEKVSCVVDHEEEDGASVVIKCSGFMVYDDPAYWAPEAGKALVAERVHLNNNASRVFCGARSGCALLAGNSAVYCWGNNARGALAPSSPSLVAAAVPLPTTIGVSDVAMGVTHLCVLELSGHVSCSGGNAHGQLGDGSFVDRHVPARIQLVDDGTAAISVSCGYAHTCVLTQTGSAYCFGDNSQGQLGHFNASSSARFPLPQLVQGLGTEHPQPVSVWAGTSNTFVTFADGSVRAFGDGTGGVLGNGQETDSWQPVAFGGAFPGVVVVEVRGGQLATCVVLLQATTTPQVQCVGSNVDGRMGLPSEVAGSLVLLPMQSPPPTQRPTRLPTRKPSKMPTLRPTKWPTHVKTGKPTRAPTNKPTKRTKWPTAMPTKWPTAAPTQWPTKFPNSVPTQRPTKKKKKK